MQPAVHASCSNSGAHAHSSPGACKHACKTSMHSIINDLSEVGKGPRCMRADENDQVGLFGKQTCAIAFSTLLVQNSIAYSLLSIDIAASRGADISIILVSLSTAQHNDSAVHWGGKTLSLGTHIAPRSTYKTIGLIILMLRALERAAKEPGLNAHRAFLL
jgi:hypothetical protein